MKSNSKFWIILIFLTFYVFGCMYPYKGEQNIDNNSSSIILQGQTWHSPDSKWTFQENALLEIKSGGNQVVSGYWFLNDEKLEIFINDQTTIYNVSVIEDNKIQLSFANSLIILEK